MAPLHLWSDPLEPPHLGDGYLDTLAKLRGQRDHLFRSVKSWLNEFDESSLRDSFLPTGKATEHVEVQKQAAWTKEAKSFHEGLLEWYQAGLGRPDLLADFDYWTRMAKYNLIEVTLLTLGLEPTSFFRDRLDPTSYSRRQRSKADEFALRRFEMVRRQFAPHGQTGSVYPKNLIQWVRSIQLDCHPAFIRMLDVVDARENGQVDPIPAVDGKIEDAMERAPEGREMASMAKLLTAIAMEEYGYDPTRRRSPIPREIEGIADRLGLPVSQDTIRKYLQMGAKFLPKDGETGE